MSTSKEDNIFQDGRGRGRAVEGCDHGDWSKDRMNELRSGTGGFERVDGVGCRGPGLGQETHCGTGLGRPVVRLQNWSGGRRQDGYQVPEGRCIRPPALQLTLQIATGSVQARRRGRRSHGRRENRRLPPQQARERSRACSVTGADRCACAPWLEKRYPGGRQQAAEILLWPGPAMGDGRAARKES